jgi:hypothetical protein
VPIISGSLTRDGAAIDLLIGLPDSAMVAMGARPPIPLRGLIDTGAGATAVSRHLLHRLGLPPRDSIEIRCPFGPPQTTNRFWIKIAFVSGGTVVEFGEILVLAADCFDEGEEHQVLIGRDVLNYCNFQYLGPDKKFTFAYS